VDRSIKTVRQLEQVFEPYRVMFKELKEKEKQQPNHNVSAKKRKPLKVLKHCFGRGADTYMRTSAFRGGSWNLTSEKRGMKVQH
jgi:hypothetical protein